MARPRSIRVFNEEAIGEVNEQLTHPRQSELSFALRTDPELCERIIRDLKHAIPNILKLIEQIKRLKLSRNLASEISAIKWKLSKYEIMECDCSWQDKDSELRDALVMLDMCYKTSIQKVDLEMNDVFYMRDVLTSLVDTFEHKIVQLKELLAV